MQSNAARGAVRTAIGAASVLVPGPAWAAEIPSDVTTVAGWVAAGLAIVLAVLYVVERVRRREADAALAKTTAETARLTALLAAVPNRFWCRAADGSHHSSIGLG